MENVVTPPRSGFDQIAVVSAERFAQAASEHMAEAIEAAIALGGRAHVALAGGNTPRAAYRALAQKRLRWDRVEIYFGDERAVPPNDPQSNYRMACEALLDTVPVPRAQVHRMFAERSDLDAAAAAYAAILPGRFDLMVLGIGEDGHTASLFPGSPALNERERRVVAVESPKPPRRRLTVTPPVIESAERLIVLAEGKGKAAAVARAFDKSESILDCPAGLARRGIWVLDRAAAELLADDRHAGT